MTDKSTVEKYREQIKSGLGVDDYVVEMIDGECHRPLGTLSIIGRHPFLFHGLLAIMTNILYPLIGLKRKVRVSKDDFIFVSCPDPVFRTQNITLIAEGLHYSIIYLPNFHVAASLKYYHFFKKKGVDAFFPTVRLGHVLRAKRKIHNVARSMKGLGKDYESKRLISVLSQYVIYDEVTKNYMRGLNYFRGKWILEHQKFYFMATVAYLRKASIPSTMLQHGIFFEPIYDFIPLLCNTVLCCSQREKQIYIENGIAEDRVIVFGAPLQTIQKVEEPKTIAKHYTLLVLMTIVNEINVSLIREVLEYLKPISNEVLIRLRPRSRNEDIASLSSSLDGFRISEPGSTINDDILSCEKVISFSVDANIEVCKHHKPFVYIWYGDNEDYVNQLHCATRETYKEEVNQLLKQDFYSSFSEAQYKEVLGETDIKTLRNRFNVFVNDKFN